MTVYQISLDLTDVSQILDALETRADAWEFTQNVLNGDAELDDELRIPEECSDATEAKSIAEHFRDIISTIRKQIEK